MKTNALLMACCLMGLVPVAHAAKFTGKVQCILAETTSDPYCTFDTSSDDSLRKLLPDPDINWRFLGPTFDDTHAAALALGLDGKTLEAARVDGCHYFADVTLELGKPTLTESHSGTLIEFPLVRVIRNSGLVADKDLCRR